MNVKKFVYAFIAVFVLLEITNYLVHGIILADTYMSEELKTVFRSQEDVMVMMWLMYVMDLIWSFFFVFFFVKGYENKGIMEGLRFGLYIGLFMYLTSSFGMYTILPVPFSLALAWFIYGLIQSLLMGLIAALIYKPKAAAVAQPAAA